jgi:hypothetical protein
MLDEDVEKGSQTDGTCAAAGRYASGHHSYQLIAVFGLLLQLIPVFLFSRESEECCGAA